MEKKQLLLYPGAVDWTSSLLEQGQNIWRTSVHIKNPMAAETRKEQAK